MPHNQAARIGHTPQSPNSYTCSAAPPSLLCHQLTQPGRIRAADIPLGWAGMICIPNGQTQLQMDYNHVSDVFQCGQEAAGTGHCFLPAAEIQETTTCLAHGLVRPRRRGIPSTRAGDEGTAPWPILLPLESTKPRGAQACLSFLQFI